MAIAEIDIPEFEVSGYKIYRGAYSYQKGTVVFAEETFEVFEIEKTILFITRARLTLGFNW